MKPLLFCLRFIVIVAVGSAAIAGTLMLLGPAAEPLTKATTPIEQLVLSINSPSARSVVYDRNGNVMATFATEDRSPVKLKAIPLVMQNAVISIEDRKFYEHHGVDWAGTMRALFKNVDAGGISQGGSTITQQLVKNTFSIGRKRDLTTKAREAVLAVELEKQLSKSQILEDYLNLVYFGNGAYGVQTAVERYFPGTTLAHLSLAQAALLAGLIQSPEALNPIKHSGAAARRRSEVLDAMVINKKTTAAAAKLAKSVPLPTTVSYPHSAPGDYYIDEVRNVLLDDDPDVSGDPAEVLGATQQARAAAVYGGGLKIYTSYDPTLQFMASSAMNTQRPANSSVTASLVVIDNSDGGVRAIANGRTFTQSQFDPATEGLGRQAGSSFKVFTLAAALSHGYSPNDSVSTTPLHWRLQQGSSASDFYNLSGDCGGDVISLTRAIARSDNCAFVRTELSLGPGNFGTDGVKTVIQTAKSMGIDTSAFNSSVVSTTLGTQGVHPLEMAQAYSVLANDGALKRATFVTKIVDRNGKTIYQAPQKPTQVLDPNVARTETKMLFGPIRSGTAAGTLSNFPRPAAGKTGTTDKNVDAWFVGYTPQFTAAVWMGDPDGEVPMTNVGGTGPVFGAGYPAKIWRTFMQAATASLPVVDFPEATAPEPRARFITELGRKLTFVPEGPGFATATTTVPTVATTPVSTPATTKRPTPATTPKTTPKKPPVHPNPTTAATGP